MRPSRLLAVILAPALGSSLLLANPADAGRRRRSVVHEAAGHQTFTSPQSNPIAVSSEGSRVLVASTTSNLVDVIDTDPMSPSVNTVIKQIEVGIDPVSIAFRPDGQEAWVSNHVSDSVSVIDMTTLQVVDTIQDFDSTSLVTTSDEPVGISFTADSKKAYVALSSRNDIAVIDTSLCDTPCSPNTVTNRLHITAQEPRAIAVRNGMLFVAAFESGNQSELSACATTGGAQCTLDLADLVAFATGPNLPGETKNIVIDPQVPDRDLYVFDTNTDTELGTSPISGIGTLLYGLAVSSTGEAFIAQTDARNAENGPHGQELIDLDNRMFDNEIARVNCNGGTCTFSAGSDVFSVDDSSPTPANALATPFGIAITSDDAFLVVTAAASSRVFTFDASTPANGVVAQLDVGSVAQQAIPRGVALRDNGDGTHTAYVLNTLDNSVDVVTVSAAGALTLGPNIPVGNDPTPNDIRQGRIAFNNGFASDTGTFACASCHPDGNTDQLLWRIGGACEGCDPGDEPRTTMPIRGLRDTIPLHWDGTLGDPFAGANGSGRNPGPNCIAGDPPGDPDNCTRQLVDASLTGVMCAQIDPQGPVTQTCNDGGNLSTAERDNMAAFLTNVSYPPARSRRLDDRLSNPADGLSIRGVSANAAEGMIDFTTDAGVDLVNLFGLPTEPDTCADSSAGCHELPLGNGFKSAVLDNFDAPTMRGMTDRVLQFSMGLTNAEEILVELNTPTTIDIDGPGGLPAIIAPANTFQWDANNIGFEEETTFGAAFAVFTPVYNVLPEHIFQMFEEASVGHSGAVARQVTLNQRTTAPGAALDTTNALLDALEERDLSGLVNLRGESKVIPGGLGGTISYLSGQDLYRMPNGATQTRAQLLSDAASGILQVTLTAHLPVNVSDDTPQPLIAPPGAQCATGTGVTGDPAIPVLSSSQLSMSIEGKNVTGGDSVFVTGVLQSMNPSVSAGGVVCSETAMEQQVTITFTTMNLPAAGLYTIQVQNAAGLMSNELLFCVEPVPLFCP